jgi:hypothetical protein
MFRAHLKFLFIYQINIINSFLQIWYGVDFR